MNNERVTDMIKPQFSFLYDGKPYTPDAGTPIKTTLEVKKYESSNAIEWVVWYENTSDKDSGILSEIKDIDTVLELPAYKHAFMGNRYTSEAPKVIWTQGLVEGESYSYDDERSAEEFSYHTKYFYNYDIKYSFENGEGRCSDEIMPFFEVACKDHGYIVAIGWTGSWTATLKREKEGISFKAGLKYAEFYLKPGEKVRGASILVMQYEAGEDRYNKFRDLMWNEYTPKALVKQRHGLLANLFWGSLPSDEMINRIKRFRENGVEFDEYWIDAAWNGKKAKSDCNFDSIWADEVGDWEVKLDAHPDGFLDVVAEAGKSGAGFMLWFDTEKAAKVAPIAKEHPEYFIDAGIDYLLADFSKKEVRDYYYEILRNHIKTLNIRCYRQDFNCTPDIFWKKADEENRHGITEIYHILGMYELWDKLIAEFPDLIIDNCASGGRRIDIETLKRSLMLYKTDYQCIFNPNPDVTNVHNTNASRLFPITGCSTKRKMDTYAARSTYSATWGIGSYATIFHSMTDDEIKWLGETVKEYRKIRNYFTCHFHNFGSDRLDTTSWVIWQYHDKDADEGMVMAFRREDSPCCTSKITLKELSGEYTFTSLDTGASFVGTADLTIELPEKYSSTIITYKK